jgi:L-alanine-DL-glutamate epimerase-like enolase superfamily enzyme
MARRLSVAVERWPLARPFTISRGTKTVAEVVVAEITDGTVIGRGEGVPYARYGETPLAVAKQIRQCAPAIARGADRDDVQKALPPGAARNALDCALWDLQAKTAGRRAWELAAVAAPQAVITAETIAIDTTAAMAEAAARLSERPLIKVKFAREGILERMRAIRAVLPAAGLIIDANEGWDMATLMAHDQALAALGVIMIEQPLPAAEDRALSGFRSAVPLCADESCHTSADVASLAGRYQMVNIKLDKAGGLSEALRTAAAAREAGLGVMVGCMVATSLAMAPAMVLAPLADFVDLDGPLWLACDREPPLRYQAGWVSPPVPALWG